MYLPHEHRSVGGTGNNRRSAYSPPGEKAELMIAAAADDIQVSA
jgi:hypothetical protein